MADAFSSSGFSSHALAVFRCSSDGDMTGALAAAALWQQQQPCRLSDALVTWLDTIANKNKTETMKQESDRDWAPSDASHSASDSAVCVMHSPSVFL